MTITYQPKGVCSRKIEICLEDGVIKKVVFSGGCSGNSQGVAALCIGRKAEEVIPLLKNIRCGFRGTSCPAQLALALEQAIEG
ncbi:MAG: TIGR03905 family TSCPD domain-containing protein [Oscillospiraceae bacterium]